MLHKVSQTDIKGSLSVIKLHIENIKKEYKRLPDNQDPTFFAMIKELSKQCNNMQSHLLNIGDKLLEDLKRDEPDLFNSLLEENE